MLPPNIVVYSDAFTDLAASVRYVYTRGGVEQDVILNSRPPSPEDYGLNPKTTRLQVLTEFVNPPVPGKRALVIEGETDESLDFGDWKLVPGRAYSEPEQGGLTLGAAMAEGGSPVTKRWLTLEGRQFLVEEVPVAKVRDELDVLPVIGLALAKPVQDTVRHVVSTKRLLPAAPKLAEHKGNKLKMRMADASPTSPGFVMDYISINGSLTNYTFQADSTYYVSGPVYFYGTNFLEGGTVLKYSKYTGLGNLDANVRIYGRLRIQTAPYRPAVFTAKDDDTVGETISGSTGNPSGYYAYTPLYFISQTDPLDIHDLRSSYAVYGLLIQNAGGPVTVRNSQFCKNSSGVYADYTTALFRNLLIYQSSYRAVYGYGSTVRAENLTIHKAFRSFDGGTVSATNCLLVWVTNWPTAFTSVNNVTNNSSATFQTVGAGAHYLADNSAYRNAGTTNIDATLLAALRQKTTYPPVLLTNKVSSDVTLSPQAGRDTDQPDLGYHYDPLDYITSLYTITNATLTLSDGVAVGSYNGAGIWPQDGSQIISVGSPTALNRFARYSTVQEQPVKLGTWALNDAAPIYPYAYGSVKVKGNYQFTEFSTLAGGGYHLFSYYYGGWQYSNLVVRDCQFRNGRLPFQGDGDCRIGVTNNLFERSVITASSSLRFFFQNNLVRYGQLNVLNFSTNSWVLRDNSFDACTIDAEDSTDTSDHNAYINTTGTLSNTNATDVFLSSFAYINGPLGNYCQVSTNLLNRGSTNADAVGLYHHTTQTNQVKETNSIVDIGFHYVAVDGNGNPMDTDGDGLPDYLEDANGDGNGANDATSWQSYNSQNGLASGSGLQVFTPLK